MRVFDPVAGGEALVVLDVGDEVLPLTVFADPATGAPRLACASGEKVLVFDPVAGGDALLVLDIGSDVMHWRSSRNQRRRAEARVRL